MRPVSKQATKLFHPWAWTPQALADGLHFHASGTSWKDVLPRPGRYDQCFWTAENALIAQTYISEWPCTAHIKFHESDFGKRVTPRDHLIWDLAKQLGADAQILAADPCDRPTSWRYDGNEVTYQHVIDWLATLGYEYNESIPNRSYTVKLDSANQYHILPAKARPQGRLVIIDPLPGMNIKDFALDEGDLTDLQYHKVDEIEQAFLSDADCVRINDFCQSSEFGNVGHISYGYSAKAIAQHQAAGRVLTISATRRDWTALSNSEELMTADFMDWHFSTVLDAIAKNEDVPSDVVMAHVERLDDTLAGHPNLPVTYRATLDPNDFARRAADEQLVEQLRAKIRVGDLASQRALFAYNEQGKLVACGLDNRTENALIEAARLEGKVVPVHTYFITEAGRPLLIGELEQVLRELDAQNERNEARLNSRLTPA